MRGGGREQVKKAGLACSVLSVVVSVCVLQTEPLCSSSRKDKSQTVLQEVVTCVTLDEPRVVGLIPPLLLSEGEKKEAICSKLLRKALGK